MQGYAEELRRQMELDKAKKDQMKAEEAMRDKSDYERILREQQRDAAMAHVARDQFGNPLPPHLQPHHQHQQQQANFQNLAAFQKHQPHQPHTAHNPNSDFVPGSVHAGMHGGDGHWGGPSGEMLNGHAHPIPPPARRGAHGMPPPAQPLNELQAELQQQIEEKKRRKEEEEAKEKELERKDAERLQRQQAELAQQAARDLEKKMAKDAQAAGGPSFGAGGMQLQHTPLSTAPNRSGHLEANSPVAQRQPHQSPDGMRRLEPPPQRLSDKPSREVGQDGAAGTAGDVIRTPLGVRRAAGDPVELVVRVEDSIDDPLARERLVQMGGMGHGGVQEGDMAVVKTVESDELARVQNELQKEQKRLEDLVKLQKQELSNLKHQLGGKGLVGSPLATASNAPSPGARQDARTDKVQNNRTEERSESGWLKGGEGQLGGGASSVGWENRDQRGMDGQVPYSIEKSAGQHGLAEWGSAVGPLVLPHDLKYLQSTGLSRPGTGATANVFAGDVTGGVGVGKGGKAGNRYASLVQEDRLVTGGPAEGQDEVESGMEPPPPHSHARSPYRPPSRVRPGGRAGDWNLVDLSLEGGESPASTPSSSTGRQGTRGTRGGVPGIHVAQLLEEASPRALEKSLAGQSACSQNWCSQDPINTDACARTYTLTSTHA